MAVACLAPLLLLLQLAGVAAADERYPVEEFSLPPQAAEVLGQPNFAKRYRISFHVNPYYLNGDFDGDGALDTAVLIREIDTKKAGIALIHAGSRQALVLGAGNAFDDKGQAGADDFAWLDAWHVYARGVVHEGVEAGPPPTLKGDAILAMKSEAASGLIYWTGQEYAWYQQGD